MSPDFGGCAMTAHPLRPVIILPKKVTASVNTKDVSPDMAARHHDTKNNTRGGILSLLLSVIMLVKPTLVSSQASQPQGPVKEPQKVEAPLKDTVQLNKAVDTAVTLESPYLRAVREFADNVLKYGRDTYGPKHTPLFVDGLNIHTHEPVKWISPKGDVMEATETEEWILSNFASQQTLLRTLDGLSAVTGDPKYRDAAMQATKYAFENLRAPNGLFYWGEGTAFNVLGDTACGNELIESIKLHYPYYELMWKVDPEVTKKLIGTIWSAHVLDWSSLEIDRIGSGLEDFEKPWDHEYKGGPTIFKNKRSWGISNMLTASSLIQSGIILNKLSGEQQPLVWSKRLAKRFVDTRYPNTGISSLTYGGKRWQDRFVENMQGNSRDPNAAVFPWDLFQAPPRSHYYPENAQAQPWIALFLVGELLGENGREFTQWAIEELNAWGKASYRKKDNCFVPMLTDGTSLEGRVWKNGPGQSTGYNKVRPYPADMSFFWAYSIAYGRTGDEFMWEMVRSIALGNELGDIGQIPMSGAARQISTNCSHPYGIFGFLELYRKTNQSIYLEMARRIADNIVEERFYKGFFVQTNKHFYTRLDCFEPLALLRLEAAMRSKADAVPQPWPSLPLFVCGYRYKIQGVDRHVIYGLTESSQLPLSIEEAAAVGDVDLIKRLIEKGVKVDAFDSLSYMTALHRAAMEGHKPAAELLLAKGAPVNERDMELNTPLIYAVLNNHKEVVELLLAHGADVNIKDDWGRGQAPLDIAFNQGNKEIIKLLLDNGAKVTSFHQAVQLVDLAIVKALFKQGADVNAKNNAGQAPLDIAIGKGNKEIIKLLLDNGAKVTSFHQAVQSGDLAIVKALFKQGADVNAKDKQGKTALFYAGQDNHKDMVEFLIAKGADVNAKDKGGYTPLYYAFWSGNKDLTTLLISKGAEVNAGPEKDYPLIYYAVWNEDLDTVKLLVAKGAKFDVKILEDRTAFHYAVGQGSRDIAEFLVSKGIDASTFHVAAGMGDLARVKNHIEQGADVNTQDELGWTPLYWAASLGQTEVARLLIDKGADVRTAATDGGTALYQAAQAGDNELAELLLSKGADVNAKDKRGNTPLFGAVSAGHSEAVELLIAKGADVNAKTRNNRTPLHRAAISGHKDVVEILITNGADVAVKDSQGRTPLDYARLAKREEIIDLLSKYRVKSSDTQGDTEQGKEDKDPNSQSPDMAAIQATRASLALAPLALLGTSRDFLPSITPLAPLGTLRDHGRSHEHKGTREITHSAFRTPQNDLSPDMTAGSRDTGHNTRNGILRILLSAVMLVKPSLASTQTIQSQGPAKEPQKVEQPVVDRGTRMQLFAAIRRNDIEKAKKLLTQGIDVNKVLMPEYPNLESLPLELAIASSSAMLELIIAGGADINVTDKQGLTIMHKAAAGGQKENIVLLFKHGAVADVKDNNGRTPLHYASGAALKTAQGFAWQPKGSSRNIEIVKFLIEKGVDVNVKDKYGLTSLHYATIDHSVNIIALLLDQGVFVDVKDNAGRTPLHYAAGAVYGTGHVDIWTNNMAKILLDKGADINAQDNIGWTPLHYSAYVLNKNMVEYFIQKGADLRVVDKRGYTPYLWNRAKASYYQRVSNLQTSRVAEWQKYIQEYNEILRLLRKSSNYYVASDGRDTNPGTLDRPFRTIAAVIDIVEPGDVIFMRGGIHHCPSTIYLDKSGEQDKPICIRPYPGEIPILDFSGAKGDSILITGAYWRLKGLAITNGFRGAIGLYGNRACYNVLEQMKVYDNRYAGIRIEAGAAYNIILNCDSYHNCDLEWGGEDSDGFGAYWNIGKGNILIGNRAWSNSDDGYDLWDASSSLRLERCYAWRNGENIWDYPLFIGNGNGFKLGRGEGKHVVIGCFAWGQSYSGTTLNGNTSGVIIRNCTFWDNDTNYYFEWSGWKKEAREGCVFSNNISYNGHKKDRINPKAQSQHNNWDASLGLTLTDDDFLSLDDSMMSSPRNPDGSIPQNNFLKLAPGSAAIDKGIDIGMPFVGQRPDLGAFEYDPNNLSQGYVKMLHQAVRDRDIKKIKELLVQGEGINDKDWLGYTPLQWAVYFGYPNVVELLISQGADPDIQSDTGRFALEIAKAMVYADIEALLRKHGAKQ